MIVRGFEPRDREHIVRLMADFRVTLAGLRGDHRDPDIPAARDELAGYTPPRFRIFVGEYRGEIAGFLVCRKEDDVVWAESLYVTPERRRTGIASRLFREAERLAAEAGSDTVYTWIHPNNDEMIGFLASRGYTVLNLIEIRKRHKGEDPGSQVSVNGHGFDY